MARIENESQDEAPSKSKKRLIPYGAVAAACAAVMIVVAGRHVIPMTDSISVENAAEKAVEVNKDEAITAVTAAPEVKAQENSASDAEAASAVHEIPTLKIIDSGDSIEVSTSSLLVSSPSYTEAQLYEDEPTETVSEDGYKEVVKGGSPIQTIFDYVKDADFTSSIAVIVCDGDDVSKDLSRFYSATIVHRGITADRYIINESAMPLFVEMLSAAENKCWKLPGDLNSFGFFHLYLITDSENS